MDLRIGYSVVAMRSDKFLLLIAVTFCAMVWSSARGWVPVNYWSLPHCFVFWLVAGFLARLNRHLYDCLMARRIRRSLRKIGMREEQVERQVKHWVTDRKKPR
jgi:hypothetical protein